MNESENYKFKLPSRDSEDIADINEISDNFRIADQILKSQEVELGKKIEGSVATEISNNSKSTEFPPASLVFEEVSDLSIALDRKIAEVKSVLDKRVTNLEQGITPSPFETDNTTAYSKDVPVNALPYAEVEKIGGMTYKDGDTLRSAKVTEVESVGANLTTAQEVYKGANKYLETTLDGRKVIRFCANILTNNKVLKFKENTQYTVGGWFKNEKTSESNATANAYIAFFYTDGTSNSGTIAQNADWGYYTFTSTNGKTVEGVGLSVYNFTSDVYVDVDTFMLNKGSTALPYSPYIRNTLPIPPAVQALDGYGDGVNESVYNYIDWEKKQFVKQVGKVDLGALNWGVLTTAGVILAYSDDLKSTIHSPGFAYANNILCGKYPTVAAKDITTSDKSISTNNEGRIYAYDSAYTDAATFKATMSGVMLYYELAEPIITDISDLLPEDNFIGVEGGGTVTFKNEHEYAVPSEITYQIKEVNV
jgi:hypothetical protein